MTCNVRKIALIATAAAPLFMLEACSSSGQLRVGSVGIAGSPGGSEAAQPADAGGQDQQTANAGGAATGNGAGTGGTSGAASGGGSAGASPRSAGLLGGVLVTAGNAVLTADAAASGVATPLTAPVPVAGNAVGALGKIVDDTGHALVDAGMGQATLVSGAMTVIGDIANVSLANQTIAGGAGTPAIGVDIGGSAAPAGSVASVGVLSGGSAVSASVPGVGSVAVLPIGGAAAGAVGAVVAPVTNAVTSVASVTAPVIAAVTSPVAGAATNPLAGAAGAPVAAVVAPVAAVVASVPVAGPIVAPVVATVQSVVAAPAGGATQVIAPLSSVVNGALGGLLPGR